MGSGEEGKGIAERIRDDMKGPQMRPFLLIMMRLNESIWNKLPFRDFRGRFFVESYWELLHRSTPHFYQARLMNVVSCSSELVTSIDDYKENEKNVSQLKNTIEEFDACWANDHIAVNVFKRYMAAKSRIVKNCVAEKFDVDELDKLKIICKGIISNEDLYGAELIQQLKYNLCSQEIDITKKDRLLAEIYRLASLFITFMLNKGYSPTYLFNRMEYFTREGNYKGRGFDEQVDYVFYGLNSSFKEYDVYFGVSVERGDLPDRIYDVYGVQIIEGENLHLKEREIRLLSREFEKSQFAQIKVRATDYVSASWFAKENIDKTYDLVLATRPKIKIFPSSYCVVSQNVEGAIHNREVNISQLVELLTTVDSPVGLERYDDTEKYLKKLKQESVGHIGRSLRYLRLGKESSSLEQKLLNI